MNSERNEEMVRYLLAQGYADERVAGALRKIPRELFVPKAYEKYAYADNPLPIGHNQTISAPGVVAFMTKSLDVREGLRVLEIGSGSGWQACLLAELAGENGEVISVERVPELVALARENAERAGCKKINFIYGDGSRGYGARAPYDRIMVTAAAPAVPKPLVEQLKKGGKLLAPVGGSYWQELTLVEKNQKGEMKTSEIMSVVFVPLIGEHGHKI
ncbi:MAG: protein-L-isoaspartate(D-aspartate) O-methyltransferase [Candidatus Micrarchaeota archaeon]